MTLLGCSPSLTRRIAMIRNCSDVSCDKVRPSIFTPLFYHNCDQMCSLNNGLLSMINNIAMIKNVFLLIFLFMPVSYLSLSLSLARLSDQPNAKDQ